MEATQSDLNSLSIDNDSTLSSSEIYQANTSISGIPTNPTNISTISGKEAEETKLEPKATIIGLFDRDIEIGEDELRNEHDYFIVNLLTSNLIQGRFIMTRFKVIFVPYEKNIEDYEFLRKLYTVELTLIEKITKYFNKKQPNQFYIDIFTKDFRQMRIIPRSYPNMEEVYNNLVMIAFPSKYSSSIFALKYKMTNIKKTRVDKQIVEKCYLLGSCKHSEQSIETGKHTNCNCFVGKYKFENEYTRMGIEFGIQKTKDDPIDEKYQFRAVRCWSKGSDLEEICKTYPEFVIIPNSVTYFELEGSAKFRTKRRFPALSYFYKRNGTSLWRSSQNKGGITSRSVQDENMLLKIGMTNPNSKEVIIYDARSKISAMANKIKKGGYENVDKYYTNCRLYFCGIDNIHCVRDSYK